MGLEICRSAEMQDISPALLHFLATRARTIGATYFDSGLRGVIGQQQKSKCYQVPLYLPYPLSIHQVESTSYGIILLVQLRRLVDSICLLQLYWDFTLIFQLITIQRSVWEKSDNNSIIGLSDFIIENLNVKCVSSIFSNISKYHIIFSPSNEFLKLLNIAIILIKKV